jgi:hypothetical protein
MTGYNSILDGSGRIGPPGAECDESTGPPAVERDDHNDYAAYWQARSGFFAPVGANDHGGTSKG